MTRNPEKRSRPAAAPPPRELPAYSILEAAHYLQLPETTLRSWVAGRPYRTQGGVKRFEPLIELPDHPRQWLSFVNLVEAHVLAAIRRAHELPLNKVRHAIEYLQRHYNLSHPLSDQPLETDGLDLFIQHSGLLIAVSQDGQLGLEALLRGSLRRIERSQTGTALRLYPFTRGGDADEPKRIVIDPRVSFGRPALAGRGIPTTIIAERYKAGESVAELARDYACQKEEIEEAIRCELQPRAA